MRDLEYPSHWGSSGGGGKSTVTAAVLRTLAATGVEGTGIAGAGRRRGGESTAAGGEFAGARDRAVGAGGRRCGARRTRLGAPARCQCLRPRRASRPPLWTLEILMTTYMKLYSTKVTDWQGRLPATYPYKVEGDECGDASKPSCSV